MSSPNGVVADTAPVTLADLRAAERMAHDVFRTMVDALSHPGCVVQLPPAPESVPTLLLPVLALSDIHTSLAVVGQQAAPDGLRELLHRATGSPTARPGDADLVVSLDPDEFTSRLVDTLRIGSAMAPELGARLIAGVTDLVAAEPGERPHDSTSVAVTNSGPGSSSGRTFHVGGVEPAALRALDRRNDAYPAGVDLWMVAPDGSLVGLPRSNRLDVVRHEED